MCPHGFFPNTKYDLKSCSKRHDDIFKMQFENDKHERKLFYEKDFLDETLALFERHVEQVDMKVKKIKNKQDNKLYRGEISVEYQEKIDLIDLEIKRLVKLCETLGDEGEIDEVEKKMEEIEKLREDKDAILSIAENPMLAQKQMKLCEICGAMQSINDMERRTLTHLDGKMHVGFAKMRKEIERMKKRYESVLLELEVIKEKKRRKEKEGEEEEEGSRKDKEKKKKKKGYFDGHDSRLHKRIKKEKKHKKSKKSKKMKKRRKDSTSSNSD